MMGLGTPHYVTIKYDSDAATVYPPTIRHLLKSLQIEVSAFLEA
jgi:hypothetical protein